MADATREPKLTAPTRGTHSAWLAADPIVAEGVLCLTTSRAYVGSIEYFIGDGATHYSQLPKFGDAIAALGEKNTANGIAGLDANAKVPLAQIPTLTVDKVPPVTVVTAEPTADQLVEGQVVYIVEA